MPRPRFAEFQEKFRELFSEYSDLDNGDLIEELQWQINVLEDGVEEE